MQPFRVHWSPVSGTSAQRIVESNAELFALWPSPVNDDACFRAAGFTDFGDADNDWDANSAVLTEKLLSELSTFGQPHLLSKPAELWRPWYMRLVRKQEHPDVRQQIQLTTQWENLPDCVVSFGDSGISLRTGRGHIIYWISSGRNKNIDIPKIIERIAKPHPLIRTELNWDCLL